MIKTDSMLVAYVDGELDPATAHRVEALLASDTQALQRVEIFRETALLLRAACDEHFYGDEEFYADDEFVSVPARRRGSRRRHSERAVVVSFAAVVARSGGAKAGSRVSARRDGLSMAVTGAENLHSRDTGHLVECRQIESASSQHRFDRTFSATSARPRPDFRRSRRSR